MPKKQLSNWFFRAYRYYHFKRWQKTLAPKIGGLAQAYANIDGFKLSKSARREHDDISLTYGEIDFWSFAALLSQLQLDASTVFYDLGAGNGKAILCVCQLYPIKKAVGIERLAPLVQACHQVHASLNPTPVNVEWIHADFLDVDITEATCVFINASAYFGETWTKIVKKLKTLSPGAQIILSSKQLKEDDFKQVLQTPIAMSWGTVTVRVYELQAS